MQVNEYAKVSFHSMISICKKHKSLSFALKYNDIPKMQKDDFFQWMPNHSKKSARPMIENNSLIIQLNFLKINVHWMNENGTNHHDKKK